MQRILFFGIAVASFAITPSLIRSDDTVTQKVTQAQMDRARLNVKVLETALKSYFIKYGDLPQKLSQLVQPPNGDKPFIEDKKLLQDPWG